MTRRMTALAAMLVAGAVSLHAAAPANAKHRGMTFLSGQPPAEAIYGSEESGQSLQKLKELGVEWIAIVPYGYQITPQDFAIRFGEQGSADTDENLLAVTKQAHALGIKVMLKPHLMLPAPMWAGQIQHRSEDAWRRWFTSYREFILHYAALAKRANVDAFCIGNELKRASYRQKEWRAIIKDVRAVYSGPVTYGANFDEVHTVQFWDALDMIGVSGYFPLLNATAPTKAELVTAWQPVLGKLNKLSTRWQKPILFTELGYRSADRATWKQWELKDSEKPNPTLQANAYAAFFEAVWTQPWVAGVYWWRAHSWRHDDRQGNGFEIAGKPAADVLKTHYGKR